MVNLLRNVKKEFYGNLNTDVLTENRTFWKTVKPFLSEKSKKSCKITDRKRENCLRRQRNSQYLYLPKNRSLTDVKVFFQFQYLQTLKFI